MTIAAAAVADITGRRLLGSKRPLLNALLLRGFSSTTTTKAEDLQHGVSRTSIGTAMLRAVEQQEAQPLFHDPYAAILAGNEGDAMMKQFEEALSKHKNASAQSAAGFLAAKVLKPDMLLRTLQAMVPVRHKFFDDYVLKSLHDIERQQRSKGTTAAPPLQFVNVACGLDSRAFRLAWPEHTRVYEVDRSEVLKYKAGKLESVGAKPSCAARRVVEADVTDPWEDRLQEQGFDPKLPTVWLAEGLLPYLSEPEISRLLRRMRASSGPGSFVGADHPGTRLARSQFAARLMDKLQDMKAPLISSTDDPEELLRSCGWDSPDVSFLGETRAHYGRWPIPPVPAFVPPYLMPRFWLMTAQARR